MSYKHIIWDYNGTLLDDVQLCIDSMNELLEKYQLEKIDIQEYKQIFDFPVKDYYQRAGFNFDIYDFDVVGLEFIEIYNINENKLKLKNSTLKVLQYFKSKAINQSILSAREQNKLLDELKLFKINTFFENVYGLDNHLAAGKIDIGRKLIKHINIPKNQIVMIGDTIHDFDVAEELGIDSILIADGHQDIFRLQKCKTKIINVLTDLFDLKIFSH